VDVCKLFSLEGKVALVTGGAGKYGKCIVRGLAEAGATVVAGSRNIDACLTFAEECQAKGLDVRGDRIDLADEASVNDLCERMVSELGKVDILVNNAVMRPTPPPSGSLAKCWSESMAVNAVGLCVCINTFIEHMIERKSGSIINIASMYGLVGQNPNMYIGTGSQSSRSGDYWFHKAGMINYTRFLAARYGRFNIRVNCISPGGFLGEGVEANEFAKVYSERVPLGRMANEDDIKGAAVYLASDASMYVTGHNLVVDGGWTIW
jgi:NAD(P)-dependent dehydrogenase (short-subunit alcohol dehydrogenase family)